MLHKNKNRSLIAGFLVFCVLDAKDANERPKLCSHALIENVLRKNNRQVPDTLRIEFYSCVKDKYLESINSQNSRNGLREEYQAIKAGERGNKHTQRNGDPVDTITKSLENYMDLLEINYW